MIGLASRLVAALDGVRKGIHAGRTAAHRWQCRAKRSGIEDADERRNVPADPRRIFVLRLGVGQHGKEALLRFPFRRSLPDSSSGGTAPGDCRDLPRWSLSMRPPWPDG